MRSGDTLVVWKLNRFGLSLTDPIEGVGKLRARGIEFRSFRESIDPKNSPMVIAEALGVSRATLYRRVPRGGLT